MKLTIKLVFVFTMMIQLQLMTARPQKGREIGPLQTFELKHPELPTRKRVELALIDWNTNYNNNCAGQSFWYMGTCNRLNDVSRFCANRNDFIVLKKPSNATSNCFTLTPVCKELPCRYDRHSQEVWWPSLNKCLKEDAAEDICGHLGKVEYNVFGEAFCKCNDISANTEEGGRCYGLFYQGPCKVGEIFEPRDRYTTLGKCIIKKEIAIVNLNFGTITYIKPQKQEGEEDNNEKVNQTSENREYKDDKNSQIFQERQETADSNKQQKNRGQ